ncbi:MAG: class I SAM-dependent methyltransferase [Gemmatimonadaceae bacterium]|nr:class I SAM-dependent methyltransferase [Gemmatimonadaceae bacterium]
MRQVGRGTVGGGTSPAADRLHGDCENYVDGKSHWEHVYRSKSADQVSWFEPVAAISFEWIREVAPALDSAIIDVGGGASRLADGLLAAGYARVIVLDLSAAALLQAQRRLGSAASAVEWREADILGADLPAAAYDVWHDRAVFHFLTDAADRTRYVAQLRRAVRAGGHVIMATFAEHGPRRCSGLDVSRYSPAALQRELGADFRLVESLQHEHRTPAGASQAFTYCLFRHEPARGYAGRSMA